MIHSHVFATFEHPRFTRHYYHFTNCLFLFYPWQDKVFCLYPVSYFYLHLSLSLSLPLHQLIMQHNLPTVARTALIHREPGIIIG